MEKQYFDKNNRFVIENYNDKKPFSSFLPGIAGIEGLPLWAFYVNRGQGICSFGVKDKNSAIMEFFPAYKAYQNVFYNGFRTFIKVMTGETEKYYEPFSKINHGNNAVNKMYIGANEFEIEETSEENGLRTNVLYFMLPEEDTAALVRKTTITNISDGAKELEILDGIPCVLPYGMNNTALKEIGHTLKAWMSVQNLENDMPFYKLRASTEDSAEVKSVEQGHFYLSFVKEKDKDIVLKPIVDSDVIFGNNTSLSHPDNFIRGGLKDLYCKKQAITNKVPSGFSGIAGSIVSGEAIEIYSLIGYAENVDVVNRLKNKLAGSAYIDNKYTAAKAVVRNLTEDIATSTSYQVFDEYCRQTYLDNLLRGGYPIAVRDGESPMVYHVYSRKHGDIERDYNFFSIEPEFYSSGNGNYRDVNQNRRSDVFFHPEVKDFNIGTFINMLQPDGYNPLVINGSKFVFRKSRTIKFAEELEKFASTPFTLGKLYRFVLEIDKENANKLMAEVLKECEQIIDISHGEGYWSDHWTYNLDLIENYLKIYPDNKRSLLLEKEDYTYYDNFVFVKPRSEKYVLTKSGVRQYDAAYHDEEKNAVIKQREDNNNLVRTNYGDGEIYRTSLLSKLTSLAVVKFATLDPMGMGVEMEAGKPGWNDALNGLPGIFGSSMAESYELQTLLSFINETCTEYREESVNITEEVYELMKDISLYADKFPYSTDVDELHTYWDNVSALREAYREKVKYGFSGTDVKMQLGDLLTHIKKYIDRLDKGIARALEENNGIYPTFFYYEAIDYGFILDEAGQKKCNKSGLPFVRVKKFKQLGMPLFLEGVVRAFKMKNDKAALEDIYKRVKRSSLFDEKLRMYKLNESLEKQPIEIGRLKAFTPGWLENETIWLHMEYKYMLELLKSGLYNEFYEDFKNVMIPFLDPEVYGRSILENSSFIASSANPNEETHGAGYVARLSGAAAEFLSIWNIMMSGEKGLYMKEGELCLDLNPILPGWLFDEKSRVSFNFLGKTKVTYHNPGRRNTWEKAGTKDIMLHYKDGVIISIDGTLITEPYSRDIRDGKVEAINVSLN